MQLWMYLLGVHRCFILNAAGGISPPVPTTTTPPSTVLVLLIHPFTLTAWPLMALELKAPAV